jgi:hypothetical protein
MHASARSRTVSGFAVFASSTVQPIVARRDARARHCSSLVILAVCLGALVAVAPPIAGAADKQRHFTTAEEAFTDFVAAVKANDQKALLAMLGPEGKPLVDSGDAVADQAAGERFAEGYDQAHTLVPSDDGATVTLNTGSDNWPFPIPVVKDKDGWRFDTPAGKEEILRRRIGRNELSAIEACRAYADAQREYYARSPQGDPLLQYAQKIASTPGKRDGLFWESKEGEEQSPLGPLIAGARGEGYKKAGAGGKPDPYHGYYYKVLTAQGPHARDGAYNYVANGKMIGGFALVAYPAEWNNSGVMTFLVNQDGVVFQKDLGPKTTALARAMTTYDPDSTWTPVEDGGEQKPAAPN